MRNTLTLYIPDPNTGALSEITDLYQYKMARRFGGCTVVDAHGSWINGAGELEEERVTLLTSYHTDEQQTAADVLASQLIHDLKKAGEEAVMIVRNGTAIIS